MTSCVSDAPAPSREHRSNWDLIDRGYPVELRAGYAFPLDLREWFAQGTLVNWVQAEFQALVEDNAPVSSIGIPAGLATVHAPRSLTLLAYAYVRGVFDAEGIVQACHCDQEFRTVSSNPPPAASDLKHLRRSHRGLLVTLLVRVLTRAVRARFDLGHAFLSLSIKRRLHEQAVERLDIARHMDNSD